MLNPKIRAISIQCDKGENIEIHDNVMRVSGQTAEQADIALAEISIRDGKNISARGNRLTINRSVSASADDKTYPSSGIYAAEIRKLINEKFKTDQDFMAFCLDIFPEIYKRFSRSMDRIEKVNLLIELNLANLSELEEKTKAYNE